MQAFATLLRLSVTFLLFVASSLKSYDFLSNFAGAEGQNFFAYANFAVAQLELCLCVLLACNVYEEFLNKLLIGLFTVFALKSAHSLWLGKESCGCLGYRVVVPPVSSLIVDILVLIALIWVTLKSRPESKAGAAVRIETSNEGI